MNRINLEVVLLLRHNSEQVVGPRIEPRNQSCGNNISSKAAAVTSRRAITGDTCVEVLFVVQQIAKPTKQLMTTITTNAEGIN